MRRRHEPVEAGRTERRAGRVQAQCAQELAPEVAVVAGDDSVASSTRETLAAPAARSTGSRAESPQRAGSARAIRAGRPAWPRRAPRAPARKVVTATTLTRPSRRRAPSAALATGTRTRSACRRTAPSTFWRTPPMGPTSAVEVDRAGHRDLAPAGEAVAAEGVVDLECERQAGRGAAAEAARGDRDVAPAACLAAARRARRGCR